MSLVLERIRRTRARDDRVLPITRWVARVIILVLLAAVLILYGMPGRTTEHFAWTIRPDMTPLVMGSGYAAGVYFFSRVATTDEWHRVAPPFLAITVFTWFMAIATVLHWENFNHSHHAFYLWVVIYAITPVLVPGIWWLNRQTDPKRVRETDKRLPRAVRILGGGLGLGMTLSAIVVFLVPGLLIDVWPWTVSPLTTRILSGWFALFGVANIAVALDSRWSAATVLLESKMVGFGLIAIGVVRAWGDFDPSNALTWLFVGGMALYLLAILVLYASIEFR